MKTWLCCLWMAAPGGSAPEPRNLPPVAEAKASPVEAWVDQPVAFSSAGSTDPDAGPSALSFRWDFGDGTTSTLANPTHRFPGPRAYAVTLTVSDGADTAVAGVTVFVLARPTAVRPAASGPLALADGDRELWVVNPDSDSVSVIDVSGSLPAKKKEIAVGKRPRALALSLDGRRLFVTCQDQNELWILDRAAARVVGKLRVGHLPYGVAVDPVNGWILVSNQGDDTLGVFGADLAPKAVIAVDDGPRALAVTADGTRAYVTHYLTRGAQGKVTEIDLDVLAVARTIGLAEDAGPDTGSSGRGFPNLLSTAAVEPSGAHVWIGGLKSNTSRGRFLSGEGLSPDNRTRGLLSCVGISDGREATSRRIDPDDADSVSGVAFSPSGRYAYAVHQGAGTLTTYDMSMATLYPASDDGSTVPFESRMDLGEAPQGIVVTANGRRAYVSNFLSRSITALDLSNPASPASAGSVQATPESLSASVANGKKLFYSSRAPRLSKNNYIACASCHADGGMSDGRTWDLTEAGEGLRNTVDLRGRGGMKHGPVHWSANFDEIQDFENDIVNSFGGTGLAGDGKGPNLPLGAPNAGRSRDLDDLAAYVSSLETLPRSPFRNPDGSLTPEARRGKALFDDPLVGCAACHVPGRFTDSAPIYGGFLLHDVGTLSGASGGRLGGPLPGLDTPGLAGLWDSAPYLHDGSAATLLEVLTARNPADRHGTTSQLSREQLDDLVAYLLSIDGTGASGGGSGGGACGATGAEFWIFWVLVWAIRRGSWPGLSG